MDGVLVIDKPEGWTSHDVVAKIRNLTKIRKVGHTGTLDPFATGVLPLTLGRATRLTNYFLASDKLYRGVIRFGFATATYDVSGEALSADTHPTLDADRVRDLSANYLGTIRQTLPPFSAKKLKGRPLYEYARKGVTLEPSTKEVTIRSLEILQVDGSEVEFSLSCSAGTYVRSLAHDLGRDYGCGAHLLHLRRIRSGEFPIEIATTLSDAAGFHPCEYFLERVIPLSRLLQDIPSIVVSAGDRAKLAHGADLNVLTSAHDAPEYRILDESGSMVAIAQRLQSFVPAVAQPARWVRIHPKIIF
jgi:tRNA pseudouridine55 synthase